MTDVLGICTSWGDGVCVVEPDGGGVSRARHHPAPGHRLGQAGPAASSARHRVSPARGPAARAGAVAGPRDRAAGRLAAAPLPDLDGTPGQLGAGDGPVRRRGRLRAGGRPLRGARKAADRRRAAGLGRGRALPRPRLGAGEPRPRHRLPARGRRRGPAHAPRRGAARTGRAVVGDDRLVTAAATTGDGRVVASGVAAYADDWVGFRTIEVDPAERGRGLGLLLMAELLDWGAERGATTAYLQVLGDNAPRVRALRGARLHRASPLPLPGGAERLGEDRFRREGRRRTKPGGAGAP